MTCAVNYIQSRNFRGFEVYMITIAIYLLLSIALRALLGGIDYAVFPN